MTQRVNEAAYSLPSKDTELVRFATPFVSILKTCPHPFKLTLSGGNPTPLRLSPSTPISSVFLLESYEASHSSHSVSSGVSSYLSLSKPHVRMDSQAKYGCLARSKDAGGVYMRMPIGTGYREKIWVRMTLAQSFQVILLTFLCPEGSRSRPTHCRRSWGCRYRFPRGTSQFRIGKNAW